MMRVLLVDDEPLALRRLVAIVREMPDVELVGTATDGERAVVECRRLRPDVLVLDIEMPLLNGLEVAAILTAESILQVVVVSAFAGYATDAFAFEATDYVLKPIRPERLRQALARAKRRMAEVAALALPSPVSSVAPPALGVPDSRGGHDIAMRDIKWIEAARDYVIVHTAAQSHLLRSTMAEMAARLPPTLARVHRSAFVNLDHVERWVRSDKGAYRLILSDGEAVQVGSTYLRELRALRHHGRARQPLT